jgi:hypothetical protein
MVRLNSTPLVGKVAIDFRKFAARLRCVGENKSFGNSMKMGSALAAGPRWWNCKWHFFAAAKCG